MKTYHENALETGTVHYYRTRVGQRMIFRQSEIRDVEPTPGGAILTTKKGCEYKLAAPKPEIVIPFWPRTISPNE